MGHGHDAHDGHGGGHGHGVPAAPVAPPAHVFTIAHLAQNLGLGLWAAGFVIAWPALYFSGWTAFWACAFVSLYGMCIWLASRTTLGHPQAP